VGLSVFGAKYPTFQNTFFGKKLLMSKNKEILKIFGSYTPRGGLVQEVGYFARKVDKPTA